MELTLQIEGLEPLLRRLRSRLETSASTLYNAMERAVLVAEGEIVDRTPVDTGNLRNRIVGRVEHVGARGVVEVVQVPYAVWVEHGTRPHDIVVRNARALRFVPGVARRLGDRAWLYRTARGRTTLYRSRGVAVFRRRVRHPGTSGAHMFRDGAAAAAPRIREIFRRALAGGG